MQHAPIDLHVIVTQLQTWKRIKTLVIHTESTVDDILLLYMENTIGVFKEARFPFLT